MAQSQVLRLIDFSQSAFFNAFNSMAGWLRDQLAWEAPPSVQTQHQHHKHNHNHKHAHNHGVQDAYLLRKRELPNVFTSQDWRNALEYWGHRCAVCERPRGLWHTLSQDHWIPLSSPDCPGTDPTNILPLCCGTDGCNNMPTCEECPNCCAGSLRWIYKLGEACGLWRCTGCRAEWVFE